MSMLEGYDLTDPLPVGAPPTNAETTYTRYHLSSVKSVEGNAYDLLVHPNGLCIVRLSPSHPLCQGGEGMLQWRIRPLVWSRVEVGFS